MPNTILLKRDNTPGLTPTAGQLALGELAVNTYDGKLYFKKDDGTEAVIEVGNPVPDDAVATSSLIDGSVTNPKIADLAVGTSKIAAGAVTGAKISSGAVTTTKINDSAVTTTKINDSAITTTKINDSAITSAKILNGTIVAEDIATGAITSDKILNGTVTTTKCDDTIAKQTNTTGALDLPSGTTAERDNVFGFGSLRFNSTENGIEVFDGTNWLSYTDDNGIQITTTGISMTGSYTGSFSATGNITAYSDERLKSNWEQLPENILDEALQLKYGTFDMEGIGRGVGVSAQSLEQVLPEAVMDQQTGYKSVAYGNAALALVLELNRKVARLESELEKLRNN